MHAHTTLVHYHFSVYGERTERNLNLDPESVSIYSQQEAD